MIFKIVFVKLFYHCCHLTSNEVYITRWNQDMIMNKELFIKIIIGSMLSLTLGDFTLLPAKNRLKQESLTVLMQLCDALIERQIVDEKDDNYGAIVDSASGVRAGEAVFPFAVAYKHTQDNKYGIAAIRLANWLIQQQSEDGSWPENPETWTGTTANQLLMLACAYPILKPFLSKNAQLIWKMVLKKAADYLIFNMNQRFAPIHYCAQTAASLAATYRILPEDDYKITATELAQMVAWQIDKEGFIVGEGRPNTAQHLGIDPGYNIDKSLWSLGIYAKIFEDEHVKQKAIKSLDTHLYLVYPDGSIDNSWGVRSNEWTTYGSLTANGCQASFGLFTGEDERFNSAALLNLKYLTKMMKNGIIAYGPLYWELHEKPPSLFPTFARAGNLALTIEFGDHATDVTPALPCEIMNWYKHFRTVDVVVVRTRRYMATISAYGYLDPEEDKEESQYMHRPTGGSICNLWDEKVGFLQTSTQTIYRNWGVHFPDLDYAPLPLTPRLETYSEKDSYTNLYEFNGKINVKRTKHAVAKVAVAGRLKNMDHQTLGVTYRWTHWFERNAIQKELFLDYSEKKVGIQIVEPFVQWPETKITKVDQQTIRIDHPKGTWSLQLMEGQAKFILGEEAERYRWPIPAMRCYPVIIKLSKHKNDQKTIVYRLERE